VMNILDDKAYETVRKNLTLIESGVNSAIKEARQRRDWDGSFSDESINWLDLKCASVELVIDKDSHWYQVTVEEAAPYCPEFALFLYNETQWLEAEVGTKIFIETAW
jgi:hypothetical protein